MNAIAERWIGGCRREPPDRTPVWNQAHPRQILHDYQTPPQSAPAAPLPARRRAAETATPGRPISTSTASEDRLRPVA
jgi:hypothetical protein